MLTLSLRLGQLFFQRYNFVVCFRRAAALYVGSQQTLKSFVVSFRFFEFLDDAIHFLLSVRGLGLRLGFGRRRNLLKKPVRLQPNPYGLKFHSTHTRTLFVNGFKCLQLFGLFEQRDSEELHLSMELFGGVNHGARALVDLLLALHAQLSQFMRFLRIHLLKNIRSTNGAGHFGFQDDDLLSGFG